MAVQNGPPTIALRANTMDDASVYRGSTVRAERGSWTRRQLTIPRRVPTPKTTAPRASEGSFIVLSRTYHRWIDQGHVPLRASS